MKLIALVFRRNLTLKLNVKFREEKVKNSSEQISDFTLYLSITKREGDRPLFSADIKMIQILYNNSK